MKNIRIAFLACFVLFFLSCGSNKTVQAPSLSLIWEMGSNYNESGLSDFTFSFINQGKKDLGNNWIVYFCQLPFNVVSDSLSPIIIEQISSTFYKMYPSPAYKSIPAGDTLQVKFMSKSKFIKESFVPEGSYWVRIGKDGKESAPEDIDLTIIPFTKPCQWDRLKDGDFPYPYGDIVYVENAYYTGDVTLEKTDIFPSIKTVNKSEGEFSFSKNVALKYDDAYSNEAILLKEILEKQYGCTVSTQGETTIQLSAYEDYKAKDVSEELYKIEMDKSQILIEGISPHGVYNGIQTLLQMLGTNTLPYNLPNVQIEDYPDLEYRGFMLDVSRSFSKKEDILRLIDMLSSYKMNVLHLHLSDDEGWRLEIDGLEELTTVGARRGHTLDESDRLYPAYGGGWNPDDKESLGTGYFTRADYIEILQYAKNRHMRVIPEFDFPGHARAAIKAMNARYKKYIATDKAKAEEYLLTDFNDVSKYSSAQEYTDNVINVAMPSVYRFMEKVVESVSGIYKDAGCELYTLHFGGDEVPRGAWEGSPVCAAFMKENNMVEIRELKDYFIERTLDILNKKNIRMAAWQEVALLPDESPNKRFADKNVLSYCWNTVPEWHGDQIPYNLANNGYPVILSNVTNLYFDLSYNKHQEEPGLFWGGFVNEYKSFDFLPYQIYKSLRYNLKNQPVDIYKETKEKLPLNPEARKQIVGVQGQLWSETVRNFGMVEYDLLPKMFGLIERGWNVNPSWANTDNDSAYHSAVQHYNSKIAELALPRLAWLNYNFRIAQPGIKLIDDKLYMNSTISQAEIRFTTDGSEPTIKSTLWKEAIPSDAKVIKAKAFYLGKESVASLYIP